MGECNTKNVESKTSCTSSGSGMRTALMNVEDPFGSLLGSLGWHAQQREPQRIWRSRCHCPSEQNPLGCQTRKQNAGNCEEIPRQSRDCWCSPIKSSLILLGFFEWRAWWWGWYKQWEEHKTQKRTRRFRRLVCPCVLCCSHYLYIPLGWRRQRLSAEWHFYYVTNIPGSKRRDISLVWIPLNGTLARGKHFL